MAREVSAGNQLDLARDENVTATTEEAAIEECMSANNITTEMLEALVNVTLTNTNITVVSEEAALETYTCMWQRFPAAVSYITVQLAMGGSPDPIPEGASRSALVAEDRFPCFGLCIATYKIVKLLLIPLCFWFPLG